MQSEMILIGKPWKEIYPAAAVGFLALSGVVNPPSNQELDLKREVLQAALIERYAGYDRPKLRELPVLQAYHQFYKQFKKTYHLQLQLESVVLKGRAIPSSSCLVEAMFLAELGDLLLTAGHDLDVVEMPLTLDAAQGGEAFTQINGSEAVLKPGDMLIADQIGILSSVIYGPDQRTQITGSTKRVIYTTYAPPGVGAGLVEQHLANILAFVQVFSPEVKTEFLKLV